MNVISTTHELFRATYGKRYDDKIDHLAKCILENETGPNRYKVLPLEAGLGKSLQTDRIIGEYLATADVPTSRRFLMVKKFNADVYASAERINGYAGREVAIAVTSEEWKELKLHPEDLIDYAVIIISHERYNRLAKNQRDRENFTNGRHTLILDEAISNSFSSFSKEDRKRVLTVLPESLELLFQHATKPLLDELALLDQQHRGKNALIYCHPKGDLSSIMALRSTVETNQHNFACYKNYEETLNFVEDMENLVTNECVYNNGRLSCVDHNATRWGLDNNLILDANGSMDWQYRLDQMVTVDHQSPILTHENWTLYQVPLNSSKTSIKSTTN